MLIKTARSLSFIAMNPCPEIEMSIAFSRSIATSFCNTWSRFLSMSIPACVEISVVCSIGCKYKNWRDPELSDAGVYGAFVTIYQSHYMYAAAYSGLPRRSWLVAIWLWFWFWAAISLQMMAAVGKPSQAD